MIYRIWIHIYIYQRYGYECRSTATYTSTYAHTRIQVQVPVQVRRLRPFDIRPSLDPEVRGLVGGAPPPSPTSFRWRPAADKDLFDEALLRSPPHSWTSGICFTATPTPSRDGLALSLLGAYFGPPLLRTSNPGHRQEGKDLGVAPQRQGATLPPVGSCWPGGRIGACCSGQTFLCEASNIPHLEVASEFLDAHCQGLTRRQE